MAPETTPILMYHDVGYADSPWCITPEQFEAQMKFLKEQGYAAISLTELQESIGRKRPVPPKSVVITFDDGRKGVYTLAGPILKKYGFTATIYIVPAWIEGHPIPPEEAYSDFLDWDELKELSAAGFEIGSHSFFHLNLTNLDEAQILHQLQQADEIINQQLHIPVPHFSHPYGAYNDAVLNLIASRYQTAVTTEKGFAKLPGKFARQMVLNDTSLEKFRRLLTPPRLSLAMIVKNEEKNLAQCLQSVRGLADEVVIVDTGSTDQTKRIAAQFTDKIFDFLWIDDFAAARNEALRYATEDWVLVLDADEVIAKEDHSAIKEAINNWDISGYQVLTRNYTNSTAMTGWQPCSPADSYAQSYAGWFPSLKVRLFQRKEGVQFEGRIHEMVDSSITPNGGRLTVLPIPVHHYAEESKDPAKVQRYLELSRKKVAENPANAKACFELGILYKEAGQYADAEKAFSDSLALDASHLAPRLNLAIVQQKQQKYAAAIENYQIILGKENIISPEAHYGLGFCYFQQNQLEKALTHFQQAVKYNPSFVDAFINLGAVWERLGGFQEGIDALQDAIALSPRNARAYYNMGVIFEKTGNLAQAAQNYQKAIELNYARKAEIIPKVAKMKEVLADDILSGAPYKAQ